MANSFVDPILHLIRFNIVNSSCLEKELLLLVPFRSGLKVIRRYGNVKPLIIFSHSPQQFFSLLVTVANIVVHPS